MLNGFYGTSTYKQIKLRKNNSWSQINRNWKILRLKDLRTGLNVWINFLACNIIKTYGNFEIINETRYQRMFYKSANIHV